MASRALGHFRESSAVRHLSDSQVLRHHPQGEVSAGDFGSVLEIIRSSAASAGLSGNVSRNSLLLFLSHPSNSLCVEKKMLNYKKEKKKDPLSP